MTDFLIAFSILMLILTLVSERISNFLKLFLQGKFIYIFYPHKEGGKLNWYLKTDQISILSVDQPTKGGEKEREYRILTINIIVGFLVATIFNGNLFQILEAIQENAKIEGGKFTLPLPGYDFEAEYNVLLIFGAVYLVLLVWVIGLILYKHLKEREPQQQPKSFNIFIISISTLVIFPIIACWLLVTCEKMNWADLYIILQHITGYLGTGLFLSLGSKFWHDLLDLLFRVKNTKQIANDPATYTNYSSADDIVRLEDTIRDKVAEILYNKYKGDIDQIFGVLSHGLNNVLDKGAKVHKKVIEVEYNLPSAFEELVKLKTNGFATENFNTFYLKDFMEILHSENLEACLPETVNATEHTSINKPDICAFNESEPGSYGSFGVIEKDGKYFAVSNLHVFATSDELRKVGQNKNHLIENVSIKIKIRDTEIASQLLNGYKFYDEDGNGYDFAQCEINKDTFEKFNDAVNINKLKEINHLNHMNMYGAKSGHGVKFSNSRQGTVCNINYNSFSKKLYLYKVIPINKNVSKGDSGSLIFYRSGENIYTGMLVAKSDHYAYIQLLNF